jgi:hypothetical protein
MFGTFFIHHFSMLCALVSKKMHVCVQEKFLNSKSSMNANDKSIGYRAILIALLKMARIARAFTKGDEMNKNFQNGRMREMKERERERTRKIFIYIGSAV